MGDPREEAELPLYRLRPFTNAKESNKFPKYDGIHKGLYKPKHLQGAIKEAVLESEDSLFRQAGEIRPGYVLQFYAPSKPKTPQNVETATVREISNYTDIYARSDPCLTFLDSNRHVTFATEVKIIKPLEAATKDFQELSNFVFFPGKLSKSQLEKERETPPPSRPKNPSNAAISPPAPLRTTKPQTEAKITPAPKSKKGSGSAKTSSSHKKSTVQSRQPTSTQKPKPKPSQTATSHAGYYHFAHEGSRGETSESTPTTGPLSDLIPSPGGFEGSDDETEEEGARLTRSALRNNSSLSLCTDPLPHSTSKRSPAKRSPAKRNLPTTSCSPLVTKTVTPPRLNLYKSGKRDESPLNAMLSPTIFNQEFLEKVEALSKAEADTHKLEKQREDMIKQQQEILKGLAFIETKKAEELRVIEEQMHKQLSQQIEHLIKQNGKERASKLDALNKRYEHKVAEMLNPDDLERSLIISRKRGRDGEFDFLSNGTDSTSSASRRKVHH